MSDYLSRAAERVSGTNAAIRPALPSLFELEKHENAAAALSSPESRSNVDVEPLSYTGEKIARAVSGIQERVTSVLALVPETPAPAPSMLSTETSKPNVEQKFGDVVSPRVRTSKPNVEQKSGDVVSPKVRASAAESESRSEESSPAERSDLRPRVAQSSPAVELSPEAKESPPHPIVSRPEAGSESSVRLPSKPPEPIRPKVIEPARYESSPAIGVTAVPRRRAVSSGPTRAGSQARSSGVESSSGRTIQVTIGRLEVRAVQSAPPPPKSAPSRPKIPLEEYLRSRNRGVG